MVQIQATIAQILFQDLSGRNRESLLERGQSALQYLIPDSRKQLPGGIRRLQWTCVRFSPHNPFTMATVADRLAQKCGHQSYDDFHELQDGAIVDFANHLFKAGYITRAQISGQISGSMSELSMKINNLFVGTRRRISRLRSSTLLIFSKPTSVKSMALQCLSTEQCRWLHMCLKKRPYATKLEPLHVCKDDEQNDYNDASFFAALR
jgi:hypothetical protein